MHSGKAGGNLSKRSKNSFLDYLICFVKEFDGCMMQKTVFENKYPMKNYIAANFMKKTNISFSCFSTFFHAMTYLTTKLWLIL